MKLKKILFPLLSKSLAFFGIVIFDIFAALIDPIKSESAKKTELDIFGRNYSISPSMNSKPKILRNCFHAPLNHLFHKVPDVVSTAVNLVLI